MTVHIACGFSRGRARNSTTGLQLMDGRPVLSEYKTASETSQATTGAVPDVGNDAAIWRIANAGDGAIWVTFAASPTAAAGTTWLLPAGAVECFTAKTGDKCAVISA